MAVFLIFQSDKLGIPTRCGLQGQGLAPVLHIFRHAEPVSLSYLSFNFRDSDSCPVKLRLVTYATEHPKMIAGQLTKHRRRYSFRLLTKPHSCLPLSLSPIPKNKESNTRALHAFLKLFESPFTSTITEATSSLQFTEMNVPTIRREFHLSTTKHVV